MVIGFAVVAGVWLGPVALLPAIWIVVLAQVAGQRWDRYVLLLVVLAVALGAVRGGMVDHHKFPDAALESHQAEGTVVSMTRNSVSGGSVLVEIDQVGPGNAEQQVDAFVVWVTLPPEGNVSLGDRIEVTWTVRPLVEIPPGFAGYIRSQGAVGSANAWSVEVVDQGPSAFRWMENLRDRVSRGLLSSLPGDRGALAAGLVTGDDSRLSEDAEISFQRTGTSHITAVSGSNVAMVATLWAMLLPSTHRRRLAVVQVVVVASFWLYAAFTGLEPSVVRAATMASLMLLGTRFGRRPDPMTLLALTAAGMVLWNPRYAEMLGFWLSIVATAAIISRLSTSPDTTIRTHSIDVVQGTILAQFTTLPIVLIAFGTWSLPSVLANLLLGPILAIAFPLSFALALLAVIVPPLVHWLAWIPGQPLGLALQLVSDLAGLTTPASLDQPGGAGILLLVVPVLLAALLATRDGHRWIDDLEDAWRTRPLLVTLLGLAPLLGTICAVVLRSAS